VAALRSGPGEPQDDGVPDEDSESDRDEGDGGVDEVIEPGRAIGADELGDADQADRAGTSSQNAGRKVASGGGPDGRFRGARRSRTSASKKGFVTWHRWMCPPIGPAAVQAGRAAVVEPTYITWLTLAFMTTASVASLRSAPTMAVYGLTCVFLYWCRRSSSCCRSRWSRPSWRRAGRAASSAG
jgi:hypothetical protein